MSNKMKKDNNLPQKRNANNVYIRKWPHFGLRQKRNLERSIKHELIFLYNNNIGEKMKQRIIYIFKEKSQNEFKLFHSEEKPIARVN